MKRLFVIAMLAATLSCSLLAQTASKTSSQPPTREQVMKYFEVMHLHDQMQTLLKNQEKQMNVMLSDMFNKMIPNATSEERTKFEDLMKGTMKNLIDGYPIDDVLRDMVPVYQNHFTESDLNAIIAFYSSPVGQKVIREMPAMTAEGMRISYARLQPKVDQMIKDMQGQIQKMAEEEKKAAAPSN